MRPAGSGAPPTASQTVRSTGAQSEPALPRVDAPHSVPPIRRGEPRLPSSVSVRPVPPAPTTRPAHEANPRTPTAPSLARAAPAESAPKPVVAKTPRRPVLRPAAAALGRGLVWIVWGAARAVAAVARGIGLALVGTVRTIGRIVSFVARRLARGFTRVGPKRGQAAEEFARRAEHSRWRAYAFGWYALIVVGTVAAQLYNDNVLGAYVKIQNVVLPNATMIFVRNDSPQRWSHPRVTLNGTYTFEGDDLPPGGHLTVPVDKFAVYDNGRAAYAPRDVRPRKVRIECDRGIYETELTQ
jgi:hypothetical protein